MRLEELYTLFLKHPVVCTDTRKLQTGCLFFALKGENFNGNLFAAKALEAGAAYVIVDEDVPDRNERCIQVTDVLTTLQDLARHHRNQLDIPVLAIAGSNGKTTTKELLGSVLSQKFSVLCTPGNFNNHIGLPLTLLMLDKSHSMAVIEMGANHEKENAQLCAIACPTHGVVTNNGKDHLEGFGSLEGVVRSNSELYDFLSENGGIALVNENDPILMERSRKVSKRILYSQTGNAFQSADFLRVSPITLQPEITFRLGGLEIKSTMSGDYNFDNILVAVAAGIHFGLQAEEIKMGVESYHPKNLRSQILQTSLNRIFLDAYNANPSSMELSLRNFAAMPGNRKLAILGDMFELGTYEEEEHQALADRSAQLGIDQVWLVGPAFSKTRCSHQKFPEAKSVIEFIKSNPLEDKFIFIKGSRGMKLESLVDFL